MKVRPDFEDVPEIPARKEAGFPEPLVKIQFSKATRSLTQGRYRIE
jgi:hypothetical protein